MNLQFKSAGRRVLEIYHREHAEDGQDADTYADDKSAVCAPGPTKRLCDAKLYKSRMWLYEFSDESLGVRAERGGKRQ